MEKIKNFVITTVNHTSKKKHIFYAKKPAQNPLFRLQFPSLS